MLRVAKERTPYRQPGPAPRFARAIEVLTRHDAPVGHTRLPRYARGKPGRHRPRATDLHLPDTNAHGQGEQPHALYSVRSTPPCSGAPPPSPERPSTSISGSAISSRPLPQGARHERHSRRSRTSPPASRSRSSRCASARSSPCWSEKKLVASEAVDRIVARYEQDIGPAQRREGRGARVGRSRLTAIGCSRTARRPSKSSGFAASTSGVENIPGVHNLVVCTLCSCYPHALIGCRRSGTSRSSIARARCASARVLREFGVDLPESTEIRIWDSSAELRYLVLPERPAGTERLSEAELATLVRATR